MTVTSTISRPRSERLRARIALGAAPAALFVATSVGASCSDASSVSEAADAGTEHHAQPPGDDGVHPSDAALDAPLYDAAGPENAFPGVWTHAPGVPSYCDVRIAHDPTQLAFKWLPCASGRAGCYVLDTSWTALKGVTVGTSYGHQPARLVNGVAYLRIRRVFPKPNDPSGGYTAYVDVLAPPDGPPIAAIGAQRVKNSAGLTPECPTQIYAGEYGVGYWTVAIDPNAVDPSSVSSQTDVNVFGWAPWSAPSTFTTKSTNVVSDFGLYTRCSEFKETVLGAESFWFAAECPETLAKFDVTTQTGRVAQGKPLLEDPIAVSGGAIAADFSTTFAIAFVHEDGTSVRLVTPTAPQAITAKALDRSAGNQLVWVESDVGGPFEYSNATLWTAPLATTEASIVRRKVAKLDDPTGTGGSWGVANAGVFFSVSGANQAVLTRLTDGMGWLVDGEPNEAITQPIWVDDNDVYFQENPLAPNGSFRAEINIRRISRSSLGAPTVPSGL